MFSPVRLKASSHITVFPTPVAADPAERQHSKRSASGLQCRRRKSAEAARPTSSCKQRRDGRCRGRGRLVRLGPSRIAEAGHAALNVEAAEDRNTMKRKEGPPRWLLTAAQPQVVLSCVERRSTWCDVKMGYKKGYLHIFPCEPQPSQRQRRSRGHSVCRRLKMYVLDEGTIRIELLFPSAE